MKKITLFLTLCIMSFSTIYSQNKRACGQTMLDEAIKKDPSILEKIKENREKNKEWIRLNRFNKKEQNISYPNIPGFIPTGDPKVDQVNYQNAKSEIVAKDPQDYIKITTKTTKTQESIIRRKEILKKQNLKTQKK